MTVCIILNTIILALDRYPINITENNVVEKINIAFTAIFTIEMILKMTAMGIKKYYVGSMFNIFDSILVFLSIVDLFLSNLIIIENDSS